MVITIIGADDEFEGEDLEDRLMLLLVDRLMRQLPPYNYSSFDWEELSG